MPFLISDGEIIQEFPRQVMYRSNEQEKISSYFKIIPGRVFLNKYLLIMCGEINAFDKSGNLKKGKCDDFRMYVNMVHTNMGHWNHLNVKYANMSLNKRYVVYVANNTYKSLGTSLKIFFDGKELYDSYKSYAGQRFALVQLT